MRIVLDTNILVSGLLKPASDCGRIVEFCVGGALEICLDARILQEYRDVLHRPKFAFDAVEVDILMAGLEDAGLWLPIAPVNLVLDDPDDVVFLEVALGARAEFLVTGNRRHFPDSEFEGLTILGPGPFFAMLSG